MPSFTKRIMLWLSIIPITIPAIIQRNAWKIKQALLSRLWKGWQRENILAGCSVFFNQVLKKDLRKSALQHIDQLKQNNSDLKIVLLSASCKEWLQPLAEFLNADLICTELEYDHNWCCTGRFATPNCKGVEKVKRLLEKYPQQQYQFVCYADDASDEALQTISKQFYYRYF